MTTANVAHNLIEDAPTDKPQGKIHRT
ncbi:hypothetical protein MILUP08_44693 [Micromonospora lupini str. Lupac 08]|uniref:Uncharacterized protein n=1 Tax=Micromonospora lupini str. Lupac 08 TaxID=1150864 RepID=I0L7L8_9ACTN|nr:hypothetical protein MILUP08_44693 [Micromonospora lupini str. Lupac 08]